MLKVSGVSVKVGPAIRAIVRESSFVALALMGDEGGRPRHVAVEASGAPRLAFGPNGPIWPGDEGYRTLGVIWFRGKGLDILRAFLEAHEGVPVTLSMGVTGEGCEAVLTAWDGPEGYYSRLAVWSWGMSAEESWGQESHFDRWSVDSATGEVTYTGTVEGPRYLPVWLARALATGE